MCGWRNEARQLTWASAARVRRMGWMAALVRGRARRFWTWIAFASDGISSRPRRVPVAEDDLVRGVRDAVLPLELIADGGAEGGGAGVRGVAGESAPDGVASRLDDGVRRVEVGLARGETDDGKAALLHRSREVGERHRLGLAEGRDARVQGLVHLGADHHRGAAGARDARPGCATRRGEAIRGGERERAGAGGARPRERHGGRGTGGPRRTRG